MILIRESKHDNIDNRFADEMKLSLVAEHICNYFKCKNNISPNTLIFSSLFVSSIDWRLWKLYVYILPNQYSLCKYDGFILITFLIIIIIMMDNIQK